MVLRNADFAKKKLDCKSAYLDNTKEATFL